MNAGRFILIQPKRKSTEKAIPRSSRNEQVNPFGRFSGDLLLEAVRIHQLRSRLAVDRADLGNRGVIQPVVTVHEKDVIPRSQNPSETGLPPDHAALRVVLQIVG